MRFVPSFGGVLSRRWSLQALLALLLIGALGPIATAQESSPVEQLRLLSDGFSAVVDRASPAVVFIQTETTVAQRRSPSFGDPFQDELFRRFFGDRFRGMQPREPQGGPPQRQRSGQGSGFVVSADGFIVTNHHVVAGADAMTVTLHDGREFAATLVGSDEKSDLAVLRIEASDLPTLPLGSSDDLRVGEWVVAIGNPFGLSHTVTAGIVSAKGRSRVGIADYEDFIQTDAAINPGNSGGPLLNLDGEVVGINTAIFSRSGGYMGIGFAIPVDMAAAIYRQLRDTGAVVRGYLGVAIQDLSADMAASFGLDESDGVVVSQVEPGSPADQAGIRAQDVLLSVDQNPILDVARFRNAIAMLAPDSRIEIEIWRDGRRQSLAVTIGSQQTQAVASAAESQAQLSAWGLSVSALDDEQREAFQLTAETGVVVSAVQEGSRAARAGIRPGQLIVGVNHREVSNLEEFQSALKEFRRSERPIRLVLRQGQWTILAVLPPPG